MFNTICTNFSAINLFVESMKRNSKVHWFR